MECRYYDLAPHNDIAGARDNELDNLLTTWLFVTTSWHLVLKSSFLVITT